MKRFQSILHLALILLSVVSITSCNSDGDDDTDCTGQLQASWYADGMFEECYLGFYSHTADLLSLSFSSCHLGEERGNVSIVYLPYPPVVGPQPLLKGVDFTGVTAQGVYTIDDVGFDTDTVNTGTFTITEVDLVAKTLSATFEFTAVNVDDPSDATVITQGQVINIKYE
jgi:hypothetical protein